MELDDAIYQEIKTLSETGNALFQMGQYWAACEQFVEALNRLPEPITDWAAATWLLAAIADANFQMSEFEYARNALYDAMACPDAVGNPFIHLRLGQCEFELNNLDRAQDELTRAYRGAGKELFAGEHPKYWAYVTTFLKLPEHEQG